MIIFTVLDDFTCIELAVLLSVVESFREGLEFCFDTLDFKGFILAFDVLMILEVFVLLVVIDLFDFKEPFDFFIIAILFIDILVVVFLLKQDIPQPFLHFICNIKVIVKCQD